MSRSLVFTPIPFELLDVLSAALVPNIMRPDEGPLSVITAGPEDFSTRTLQDFNGVLEADIASSFLGQITKLFHFSRQKSENHSLLVSAREGKEYSLKSPKEFFQKLCQDDKVKAFFRGGLQTGDPSWFVTSVRTFTDAKVQLESGNGKNWSIKGDVPVGQIASGVTAAPSGSIEKIRRLDGNECFTVDGERIFAIEFRKVIVTKRDAPKLQSTDPTWKTSLDFRGKLDEEDFVAKIEEEGETMSEYNDILGELEKIECITSGDGTQYIILELTKSSNEV